MKHLLLLVLPLAALAQTPFWPGLSATDLRELQAREQRLRESADPERIQAHIKRMADAPHHAGSLGSRAVAEYALRLFREWGLEARIETVEALLPYPTERSLELLTPTRFVASLKEPALPDDPDSSDANQLPTYNAYSAAGDVTAPVVYANYGLPEDYETLKRNGIDVRGKVVLTRYGRSWRGVKPKVAQENGAAACLIYSDPREDGYFAGDAYPQGPYRPSRGVQRGSVMDMAIHPGDPLSPGWASEPGSRRLTSGESQTLMRIPVMPISYEDAQPLLAALGGPVVPEAWRGALPLTYHFGPSSVPVRFKLAFDAQTRPLHNVIAILPGGDLKDQWVLYGNHHDAWVNGANDPVSGAASLLETARVMAEERRRGWRPRRTIVFALWDGEEFGLLGSTEWVEKHADELREKAVAYLNSDSNGRGTFSASGSAALGGFLADVLRDVPDPAVAGKSVFETAGTRRALGAIEPPRPGFRLGPLGSGSDYVAFTHHLGIASLNLGFGGPESQGVYHSIYDTYAWYSRFSDTKFTYGRALTQVTATALTRLADAPLLPFRFSSFISTATEYARELRPAAAGSGGKLSLDAVLRELSRGETLAKTVDQRLAALTGRALEAAQLAPLTQLLYQSERMLLAPEGLPGRSWYRHQISAPGLYTGYGAKTMPGIREAVEAKRWDEAARQAQVVASTLQRFNQHLESVLALLPAAESAPAPAAPGATP